MFPRPLSSSSESLNSLLVSMPLSFISEDFFKIWLLVLFSSSATVYGVPKYFPVDENHKCEPINTYGRTKYFIEHIIKDWSKNANEKKTIILRYFGAKTLEFTAEW